MQISTWQTCVDNGRSVDENGAAQMDDEMIFGHIVEITVLFGATRFLADRNETWK